VSAACDQEFGWASESRKSQTGLQGKIIEFLWWMKKQGYKETTIRGKGKKAYENSEARRKLIGSGKRERGSSQDG